MTHGRITVLFEYVVFRLEFARAMCIAFFLDISADVRPPRAARYWRLNNKKTNMYEITIIGIDCGKIGCKRV